MKNLPAKTTSLMSLLLLPVFCVYLSPNSYAQELVETWVAVNSAELLESPVKASRRSVNRGERVFAQRCSVCHGDSARGNGPGGRALAPKPADLRSEFTQSQSHGALFWKITEGRGAMPAWASILKENERWNLVNYIKSLGSDQTVASNR